MAIPETFFVGVLFFLYLLLWSIKDIVMIKKTGINPRVMSKSKSSLQKYFGQILGLLTVYAVIIIILHAVGLQFGSLFSRYTFLNPFYFDIAGFCTGLFGLSICLYAQIKMGNSWRVGLDEKNKTELITSGLYAFIRNPTYLGLFLLMTGCWVIWPTWTIFLMGFTFFLILDIQVRCEEDFLTGIHGEKYLDYKKRTKRYIPFIY